MPPLVTHLQLEQLLGQGQQLEPGPQREHGQEQEQELQAVQQSEVPFRITKQ